LADNPSNSSLKTFLPFCFTFKVFLPGLLKNPDFFSKVASSINCPLLFLGLGLKPNFTSCNSLIASVISLICFSSVEE
jgi:hypothetical protein